jgi:ribose transport system permease protein
MSEGIQPVPDKEGLTPATAPDRPALPAPFFAWAAPLARRLPGLSGPMIGLAALFGVFVVILATRGQLGNFLGLGNVQFLAHVSAVTAVVALGMLIVIISGGIDLSVGAVIALATVVTVQVYLWLLQVTGSAALASAGAVVAGVAVGGLCGLTNGLAVTGLRVTPFVVTLGMMSLARGLAYWLSEKTKISLGGDRPAWVEAMRRSDPVWFTFSVYDWVIALAAVVAAVALRYTLFARRDAGGAGAAPARLWGVPLGWVEGGAYGLAGLLVGWAVLRTFDPGVVSAAVLAVGVALLLRFTVFGRHCYAIGSNEATARLCGVNVGATKVWIYTLAGLLTGWAGVLTFAQTTSGDPNSKIGLELDVIAAVVIGGASLSGGQGKVTGTLLGVLILGVLQNGVSFSGFPEELRFILIGVIVVVNTALSQYGRRRVA